MLVLASERATDGHDSRDCQMALETSSYESQTEHGIQKTSCDERNHDRDQKRVSANSPCPIQRAGDLPRACKLVGGCLRRRLGERVGGRGGETVSSLRRRSFRCLLGGSNERFAVTASICSPPETNSHAGRLLWPGWN